MRDQVGKNGENQRSESGRVHRRRPAVRGKREERGKEETEGQVAGSGREADERKQNGSGKY